MPSLFLIESVLVLDVNNFWGHRRKIGQVHNIYQYLPLPPVLSLRTPASSRVNISITQLTQAPENRIVIFLAPDNWENMGKWFSLSKSVLGDPCSNRATD